MTYIRIGLLAVILSMLLLFSSEAPGAVERSVMLGLLVLGAGLAAVLIGIAHHVAEVNREERERAGLPRR